MEPANLNDAENEDQALKELIRAQSSSLPDDGFSHRVLAALPATKTNPRTSKRKGSSWTWIAYFGGGIAGALFAATRVGSWAKLAADTTRLADGFARIAPAFAEPWLAVALTLCIISLAIAWPFYRFASAR